MKEVDVGCRWQQGNNEKKEMSEITFQISRHQQQRGHDNMKVRNFFNFFYFPYYFFLFSLHFDRVNSDVKIWKIDCEASREGPLSKQNEEEFRLQEENKRNFFESKAFLLLMINSRAFFIFFFFSWKMWRNSSLARTTKN